MGSKPAPSRIEIKRRKTGVAAIGKGTYGSVFPYEIEDEGERKKVAIKVFSSESGGIEPMIRELEMMSRLSHPHVVQFIGVYADKLPNNYQIHGDCSFHILMELADSHVNTIDDIPYFTVQVLLGLEYIHSLGIVHRDLSRRNILIKNGRYMLCDFGMSAYDGVTPSSAFMYGNAETRSPELYAGKRVSYATDIWSLGVILYTEILGDPLRMSEMEDLIQWLPELPDDLEYRRWRGRCKLKTQHSAPEDQWTRVDQAYRSPRPIVSWPNDDARDFILKLLKFRDTDRPSAHDLLQHPYLRKYTALIEQVSVRQPPQKAKFEDLMIVPDPRTRELTRGFVESIMEEDAAVVATTLDIFYQVIARMDAEGQLYVIFRVCYGIALKYHKVASPTPKYRSVIGQLSSLTQEEYLALEKTIVQLLEYHIQYDNPWIFFEERQYNTEILSSKTQIVEYYLRAGQGEHRMREDLQKVYENIDG